MMKQLLILASGIVGTLVIGAFVRGQNNLFNIAGDYLVCIKGIPTGDHKDKIISFTGPGICHFKKDNTGSCDLLFEFGFVREDADTVFTIHSEQVVFSWKYVDNSVVEIILKEQKDNRLFRGPYRFIFTYEVKHLGHEYLNMTGNSDKIIAKIGTYTVPLEVDIALYSLYKVNELSNCKQ